MGINERHGGPYDRGGADKWYGRPARPHFFVGATHQSREITEADMTADEIAEYQLGYDNGERNEDQ